MIRTSTPTTHAHFAFLQRVALFIILLLAAGDMSGQGNGNTNGGKPPIGTLGPVNLPYWKLIGNSVDSGSFAGTTNNFPFKIKVNNVLRASFTNSGMELDGNLHSSFATVDSILTTWRIMVNDAIAAKTVNASQFLQNDTLVNLVGMMTDIEAHDTGITSLWNHFSTITPSPWTINGPGFISYNGDVSISGNLQTNSITTTNINITESIKTKSAEFDTLRVAERMEVEKYIQSDTLHALSSLEVNNSLRLSRDVTVMYAEVSTKDEAVALMLQKEASAAVAIGAELIPTPGEAKPKLTVSGNTKLDGALNVSGNISTAGSIDANSITTSELNVNGITDVDELQVAGKIKAYRIVPVDGDSIIRFGTNTLIYDDLNQTISTDFGKGLAIGWGNNNDIDLYDNALALGFNASASADRAVSLGNSAMATGINSVAIAGHWAMAQAPYSLAIGNNIATDPAAENSIILGSGGLSNGAFINDKPNSLMVGFNSTIPTLFVGPAQTGDGTGNVGIGMSSPSEKLEVAGFIKTSSLAGGTGNSIVVADANGKLGILQQNGNPFWNANGNTGTTSANFIGTKDENDLIIKTNNDERIRITSTGEHPGLVGIGTSSPQKQLHVYTKHANMLDPGGPCPGSGCPDVSSHWGIRLEDYTIGTLGTATTVWDIEPKEQKLFIGKPGSPALTINDDKNVGIGRTDPKHKLHVEGHIGLIDHLVFNATSTHGVINWPKGKDLWFRTNETPGNINDYDTKMIIKDNGFVGIGTESPLDKFDVMGNIRINENDIFFRSDFSNGIPDNNHGLGWFGSNKKFNTNDASENIDGPVLYGYSGGALGVKASSNIVALSWTQAGNVGIGTTTPLSTLHVFGTGQVPSLSSNTEIVLIGNNSSQALAIGADPNSPYGMWMQTKQIPNSNNNNNSYPISLNPLGGNVGIGTLAPTTTLDVRGNGFFSGNVVLGQYHQNGSNAHLLVHGKIYACEVTVEESGWCDYVFADDYPLLPLQKLENFLKENRHLPKIPPASEVEKNGLNLGEMNKMMMEKIEELTLYLIQQDKKIVELQELVKKEMEK